MTGLEKILKVIEDDANAHVDEIIKQAQRDAEKIMNAAKQEADKKCSEMTAKTDADVQAILERAESAAVLQEKKKILNAKQQIISNVITKARNSLASLSDSEYIDIILKMVKKYAHNKEGVILFSKTDKKRLPTDISSKLSLALAEKQGASLVVSEAFAAIDGGFVLKYGDIEENCSFDALFSSAKEELSDQVNAILFE